jgi:uncharacterized surface protein with fasciclin (FAS1) repeats
MTLVPFRRAGAARAFLVLALAVLAALPAAAKPPKMRDLADTVAANPILTKFAAVIQASDLGTFLSSRGPFTLFVPTDSAFAKLPPGLLDTLLRPENKVRLQNILLFHVVNGKRLGSKDLVPLKTVLSCQGAPLAVKTTHSGVQLVEKAKIVHADIRCQNGVINEVDTVLMPPESVLPPLVTPPPAPVVSTTSASTNAPEDQGPVRVVPSATSLTDTNAPPMAPSAPVDNSIPVAQPASAEVSPH